MSDSNRNAQQGFKDRKVGLVIFGIITVLLGFLCVVLGLLGMLSVTLLQGMTDGPSAGSAEALSGVETVPRMAFLSVLGLAVMWLGVGSILVRRWARALLVILSWIALLGGLLAFLSTLLSLPAIRAQMSETAQISGGMATFMTGFMIAYMIVFNLLLPSIYILFYSGPNVRATFESRDKLARWTDRRPLPILATSLVSFLGGASLFGLGARGWTVPFFGVVLEGAKGAAVICVAAALLFYLAWGAHNLRSAAWWTGVAFLSTAAVSVVVTVFRMGPSVYYASLNLPPQQLHMLQLSRGNSPVLAIFEPICLTILALSFLFCTRRYFKKVHC